MARTTRERSRLGNTVRWHPDDHEAIEAARAGLKGAKLLQQIREAVSTWPPLSAEDKAELAALLLTPDGGADAA